MAAADILNGGTTTNDLTQTIHMEVKDAYVSSNVFETLIENQTIEQGSSAQFVIGGKDDYTMALTHARSGGDSTVGSDITVNALPMDERIITINDTIYDAREIDGREEKIAHYDVRGPATKRIGTVLGEKMDYTILGKMGEAMSATGLVGNPDAAALIVNGVIASGTTSRDKGNAIGESIMEAIAKLEEVDNQAEKMVAISPLKAAYLAQSDFINKDYTTANGGMDTGIVGMVGGAKVYKTNHLAGTGISNIEAVVFTSEVVGLVSLIGLKTESNYDYRRFTNLLTGRYVIGCDVLRPECVVGITSL